MLMQPVLRGLFATLCFGSVLLADGLADLRSSLARLQGREAIRASVELNLWKRRKDGGDPLITQGAGRAEAGDGPAGVEVSFSPLLPPQVVQESLQKAKKADTPSPNSDCMDELGARRIWEYLGYANVLLGDLEQFKLVSEEPETREGSPVHLLRFTSTPSLPAAIKKLLDKLETDVRIWTSLDGTPLHAEMRYSYKGSRFFISFRGTRSENLDLRVVGQRLVVTKHDWRETYEGFGTTSEVHKIYTLSVD